MNITGQLKKILTQNRIRMKPREIKFRAWNKFTETMVPTQKVAFEFCKWVDDDNWILMQYIGLKDDKRGKEIYEGDILEYENGNKGVIEIGYNDWSWRKEGTMLMPYYGVIFKMKGSKLKTIGLENGIIDESEIIGNIYENPKLLKK